MEPSPTGRVDRSGDRRPTQAIHRNREIARVHPGGRAARQCDQKQESVKLALRNILGSVPKLDQNANCRKQKPLTSLGISGVCLNRKVAVRVGFEPTIRFPVYTLSRRAPSTARTPHRNLFEALAPSRCANLVECFPECKHFFHKFHAFMKKAFACQFPFLLSRG